MTSPKRETECIFCRAAREADRRATLTLYRDDAIVVMLNRYPYTNGHLMVAPVAHESRLFDTDESRLLGLIRATADAQRILSDVYSPQGFNIGMNIGESAGAGITDHYHMHVVPRWGGDANFMSVTAGTRVVPEDLDGTFDRLLPHFARISRGYAGNR